MKSLLSDILKRFDSEESSSTALITSILQAEDSFNAIEQRIDSAISEASESDARRKSDKKRSSIDGIPFGVKANIDVKGVITTSGARANKTPASEDSWMVNRLRELGAIPTLTTTMAEGAVGAVTFNAFTGGCKNPLDPSQNAGGSSGGSAAVVSAGLLPFALGSDTMGSVRIPAAYCEVVGYKPSRGALSNRGLVPLAKDFDAIGLLTSSVADLAQILEEITRGKNLPSPPEKFRIVGATLTLRADQQGQNAVENILKRLRSSTDVVSTNFDPSEIRRAGLLVCELEGSMSLGLSGAENQEGYSPEFLSIMNFVRTLSPDKIAVAEKKISAFQEDISALFESIDVMVIPTTPHGAPGLIENPPEAADLTAWVNIAGLAAISIVDPKTDRSIQLISRSDETIISLALWLEEALLTHS